MNVQKRLCVFNALCLILLCSAPSLMSKNRSGSSAGGLRFDADGRFKIVQITDAHICWGNQEEYAKALERECWILDVEKPDMVIYTGDVVTGIPARPSWAGFLKPCDDRGIPFVVVPGNHDREQDLTEGQLAEVVTAHPMSLNTADSGFLDDMALEIGSSDGSGTAALVYCLDSGDYTQNPAVRSGYGWIRSDQVDWYRATSRAHTKHNHGVPYPAYAFFHIPLQEYTTAFDAGEIISGVRMEKECWGTVNSGLFSAFLDCGDVHGVFCGHDHIDDYVAVKAGIALCYGRFSGGKTTYCKLPSGARVIELTEGDYGMRTWIRELGSEPLQVDTVDVMAGYDSHPALDVKCRKHGLLRTEYAGKFETTEDVEQGRKVGTSIVGTAYMPSTDMLEPHAYVLEGKIYVPEDGVWNFHTTMRFFGSLSIDGWTVSGVNRFQGSVNLSKGFHDFKVIQIGDKGWERLRVQWRKMTEPRYRDVPSDNFYLD